MNRRTFLRGTAASGGIALVSGLTWLNIDSYNGPLTVDFVRQQLDVLVQKGPVANGSWHLSQIFHHCAQSVEYSISGYPEHKSELFKTSVGQIAFSVFSAKRKMSHQLNEVIPGAPALPKEDKFDVALSRFKKSLQDFKQYNGVMAPHFAFGELTKRDYEAAHVMHFNNHMLEVIYTNNLA